MPAPRLLRLGFALLLSLLLSAAARAQPSEAAATLPEQRLDYLAELLDSALRQSPRMLAQSYAVARSEAELQITRASRRPSVNGNLRYAYEAVSDDSGGPSNNSQGLLYSVSVNQTLFRWGETRNNIQHAEIERRLREKEYAEVYRELVKDVRQAFLRLVQGRKVVLGREEAIRRQERNLVEVRERVRLGRAPASDQQLAEIVLEETRFELERDQAGLDSDRRVLARLCGVAEVPLDRIPTQLPRPQFELGQAEKLLAWFDQSDRREQTPELTRARGHLRQAELRYRNASIRHLPKFDLFAGTSLDNTTYVTGLSVDQRATNRTSAGVSANWNLFDGFTTQALKRRALADRREAETHITSALSLLAEQKASAATQFEFAVKALSFAERRLEMARNGLTFVESEVAAGRLSPTAIEVNRAAVSSSELALLRASSDVYTRWGDLLGLLWADPCLEKIPLNFIRHGR